jgi:hypothetical protein
MKKVLACVGVLWPLAVFAAAGGGGTGHPVYYKGRFFSTAVDINGTLAVPLEDLAKAVGSNVSLEPAFQLNGNSLNARMGWDVKKNVKASAASAIGGTGGTQASGGGGGAGKVNTQDIHFTQSVDKASVALFRVNRDGAITNHVLTLNGRAYVPLSDVAKAFGGVWVPLNLAPGAVIQLNFTPNPNAILIGL